MKTEFKGKLWTVKTPNWLCIYLVQGLTTFMLWFLERQSQGSRHSPPASDHTSPRCPDGPEPLPRELLCSELTQGGGRWSQFLWGEVRDTDFSISKFPFWSHSNVLLKNKMGLSASSVSIHFSPWWEWAPRTLEQKLSWWGVGRGGKVTGKQLLWDPLTWCLTTQTPARQEFLVRPLTLPSRGVSALFWMLSQNEGRENNKESACLTHSIGLHLLVTTREVLSFIGKTNMCKEHEVLRCGWESPTLAPVIWPLSVSLALL